MSKQLLKKLETFQSQTGLSDHRIGMILASNGRLMERLRDGRRIWPDTEVSILSALSVESKARRNIKAKSKGA